MKVDRPDVDVRTRSSYYAPEPEKPNKKAAALSPETVALAKSMSGILPLAGMPLKASVAPFAVAGQRLSTVTVVLGVRQPVPESAKNGRITETTELLTSAFTPEGDARGAQRHEAKVQIRAGADGDAAYEVLARIDLPAGRYQLRLAAHSSSAGKDGSVFVDVDGARLFQHSLLRHACRALGFTGSRVGAEGPVFVGPASRTDGGTGVRAHGQGHGVHAALSERPEAGREGRSSRFASATRRIN